MAVIRCDADIEEGLVALVGLDPMLAPVVAAAGPVPLRLAEPGFSGLARIIVSQMVSKASASAIWNRISTHGVVTPQSYLAHSSEVVSQFGLSRAKAATLAATASAIVDGTLDLSALALDPPPDAYRRLVALKGIGPWTAEVYLMFCLGVRDIFPAGDVALRAAVGHALQLPQRPLAGEVERIALRWSPWRSVAARLFWAYYARQMRPDAQPFD